MNAKTTKWIRIAGKTLLWTAAVFVAALLILPLWIGPVVKGAANSIVPGIVKTDFTLGEFGFNPYTGKLHVGALRLANPTNYAAESCVELDTLDVKLAMTSIFSKKLRIEEILINGLRVSSTTGGGNFKQIARNVSGDDEETSAAKATAGEAQGDLACDAAPEVDEAGGPGCEKSGGVVIGRLVIDGLVVKIGVLPIAIPCLTFEGIGEESETGAGWDDIWQTVCSKVMSVGNALGEGAGKAMDALGSGVDALGEGAGKAVDALDSGVNALGEGAGKAVDALGSGVNAIGEGAGKAVDAFKGIFSR